MELEFTDRGRRRRLLMIIGLIMAILAGSTAFFLGNQKTATAEPATRQILVAAQTIPARTIIESSMLVNRTVPDDPSLALAVTDPSQVLGLVTAVTIYVDQPITPNLIATTEAGLNFSVIGPTETISPYSPAWRAVSLPVVREKAVGGLVQVGQHVDVIASVPISIKVQDQNGQMVEGVTLDGYETGQSTKVTMTDLEVLSKDAESDVYVLKVDLHQAEELAALQDAAADFVLALRPDGDNRIINRDGYGQTINRVIERYLFPLPRIIQVDRFPKPDPEIAPEGSPTVEWPNPEPSPSPLPSAGPVTGSPVPSPAPTPAAS